MILIQNKKIFKEIPYASEDQLEEEVIKYSSQIFGKQTTYINTKKKITGNTLGSTIPDGFLFDFSDKNSPAFYLVEVELAKHDFYRHIFPQITKFISFFKNNKSQSELIEKIHEFIVSDENIKSNFSALNNGGEIFKSIKDVVEESQNILIVIDEEKTELKEIMDVYSDTWGQMVKPIIFKRYQNESEIIYSISPEFNDIEYSSIEFSASTATDTERVPEIDEKYHFDKVNDNVKQIYITIKEKLTIWDSNVIFNPQKYYISILYNHNIAYFIPRKKKLRLVIKQEIEEVRKFISQQVVNTLSPGVQKFWGGSACEVVLENPTHLEGVVDLLQELLEIDKKEN